MNKFNYEEILITRNFLHNKIDAFQASETIDQKIEILLRWFIGDINDISYSIDRDSSNMEIIITNHCLGIKSTIIDKPIRIYCALLESIKEMQFTQRSSLSRRQIKILKITEGLQQKLNEAIEIYIQEREDIIEPLEDFLN